MTLTVPRNRFAAPALAGRLLSAPRDVLYRERARWFLWFPAWFAAGIWAYFELPVEPPVLTVAAVLLGAILLHRLATVIPLVSIASGILLLVALGFAAAKLRAELVAAPVLPVPLTKAEVTGRVEALESRPDGGRRLTLEVRAIAGLPADLTPHRIVVHQRRPATVVALGDIVRLTADLRPPSRPTRPGGFDFARANYFERIGAVAFTARPLERLPAEPSVHFFDRLVLAIARVRQAIAARITAALPGELGALANALMTGERGAIPDEINDAYRDAGIFHILSISGLHMAIMGGSVFFALRFGLAAIPAIALRYPIKKWAAATAIIAAFGYLLISGGAHATIRAFLMILVMFLAILADRPAIALRNVAIAALAILAVSPESLFNAGFQLSFAAVTALIAAYEAWAERATRRRRAGHQSALALQIGWMRTVWLFLAGTVATTLIAGLATAPLAAYHFHHAQTYAAATNLIAVPLSNLIVMPAALAAFLAMPAGLEIYPLALMGWGIEGMTAAARWVASWPGASVPVPAFSELALQSMLAGGLWLCLWRRSWRWLGLAPIAAGIALAGDPVRPAALVGEDGRLVAVRAEAGLSAIDAPGTTFALARWLAADGDVRPPEAARDRRAFRCDLDGCTARLGDARLAVARSPAALVDDCRTADILILSFPAPPSCEARALILDSRTLEMHGAHAFSLSPERGLVIARVEDERGTRPWTQAGLGPARARYWRHRYRRPSDTAGDERHVPSAADDALPDPLDPDWDDGYPLYWGRWQ